MSEENVKQLDPAIKVYLDSEAAATRKLKELAANVKSWENYRNTQRKLIRELLGGATVGKIGDEIVVTDEPKDQFSGKAFQTEYPSLHQEFLRIKSVEYLDVEALRSEHPEIAGKFTVSVFVNKVA